MIKIRKKEEFRILKYLKNRPKVHFGRSYF